MDSKRLAAGQTDLLIRAFSPLITWRRTQISLWPLLTKEERVRFYDAFEGEKELGKISDGEESGFFPPFQAFLEHPLRKCVKGFNVFSIDNCGVFTFWHHFRYLGSGSGSKEKEFLSGHYLLVSLDESVRTDLGLGAYPFGFALMVELDPSQECSLDKLSAGDKNCFFYAISAIFCFNNSKFICEWSGGQVFCSETNSQLPYVC